MSERVCGERVCGRCGKIQSPEIEEMEVSLVDKIREDVGAFETERILSSLQSADIEIRQMATVRRWKCHECGEVHQYMPRRETP